MRIEEAMLLYKQRTGNKFNRAELAEKLWPESSHSVRKVSMSRLVNGKTKANEDQIKIIAKVLDVDVNFLFDVEPMKPKS